MGKGVGLVDCEGLCGNRWPFVTSAVFDQMSFCFTLQPFAKDIAVDHPSLPLNLSTNPTTTLSEDAGDSEPNGRATPDVGVAFWRQLLGDRFEEQAVVDGAALGKGKRERRQVQYHDEMEELPARDGAGRRSADPDWGAPMSEAKMNAMLVR